MQGKKLQLWREGQAAPRVWDLPKRPGSLALRDNGGLLVAFEVRRTGHGGRSDHYRGA